MSGPAASIIPVSQPGFFKINSSPGVPLVAKVLDANGNPVSGVTVTFMPQQQASGASCTFAGGNAVTTDVNGLATSGAITANGIVGFYQVQAWVGTYPPVSGAVGPATFGLSNSYGFAVENAAAISALWTTAKADLATAQSTLATLQTQLATLEADCDSLHALNCEDIVEWLHTKIAQTLLGKAPRIGARGNPAPQVLAVWAGQGTRDLSITDQRPISTTPTGAALGLS